MVLEPVVSSASPVTVEATWIAQRSSQFVLHFEVSDGGLTSVVPVEVDVLRRAWSDAGDRILTGDVTGDGRPDVVVSAPLADVGGVADVGAVYVWSTPFGPGEAVPAKLTVPGAAAGDRLGLVEGEPGILFPSDGQELQLVDVSGDGVLDVVVAAKSADVGAVDTGAVYVWRGGSQLTGSGSIGPDATLAGPAGFGSFAWAQRGQAVLCEDVTGDGVLDVIVCCSAADVGGVVDAGAIHLWAGGVGPHGHTRSPGDPHGTGRDDGRQAGGDVGRTGAPGR